MRADQLISQLFDEWAASYARGERPDPQKYLQRSGPHREQLSLLMEQYLQAAPRPAPTDEDVELVEAWIRGDSPLAELRSRRGISRAQIVGAIVERFSLRDDQRASVKEYYHQLESGLIDPARLSKRLLALLTELLGITPGSISGSQPRGIIAAQAFRKAPAEIEVGDAAVVERVLFQGDDEVRSLFLSGD
jgi:hypothetical protein